MTIHGAKGMEFPVVFLCGLSEGIFPGRRADTREREGYIIQFDDIPTPRTLGNNGKLVFM